MLFVTHVSDGAARFSEAVAKGNNLPLQKNRRYARRRDNADQNAQQQIRRTHSLAGLDRGWPEQVRP